MFLNLKNYTGSLTATWKKQTLHFKKPSGTSRGVLKDKDSYIISVFRKELLLSIGEVSLIKGLSEDDENKIEFILDRVCSHINELDVILEADFLSSFPAVKFALEMIALELQSQSRFQYFDNSFLTNGAGIAINGLIWMGSHAFMKEQIECKIMEGYRCLKLKIGAIDFVKELDLLESIRKNFNEDVLELRVDANGAFGSEIALNRLKTLSNLRLHSIEQPIKQGQIEKMAELCSISPLPIALDEELIGVHEFEDKKALLEKIMPQYIILKPSLLGGFKACQEWIAIAKELKIGWWITSALESNIGLNAIAQYTSWLNSDMYQGLGTGSLYLNNIDSPLEIRQAKLYYNNQIKWAEI